MKNNQNKTTNKQAKEVKKVTEFKYITSAYKTKDNKKMMFTIDGHKYILLKTTTEDYMYSGIRADYKIVEIIEKGGEQHAIYTIN